MIILQHFYLGWQWGARVDGELLFKAMEIANLGEEIYVSRKM